ncbi:MAG: sigma 54-interacting transcriptional regulator [Deltaproteobacteria bacterium]|nr:sigma 54-interacting transcriptional regulator [Deltaproteobacteria bacterium]
MSKNIPTLNEDNEELIKKIKWLLFLRVIILSFLLGATALFHVGKGEGDPEFFHSLQIPLILAYLFSIGSALLLNRIKDLVFFAHAQVVFDVLLVTGVVLITGDIESPFPFLYNLAIANSSVLLFYRGAFFAAGFSSICYALLLLWSHHLFSTAWISTFEPLVINVPGFFIMAFLFGFLARRLRETEQRLQEKQREYLDLEVLKEALLQGMEGGVSITDVKGNLTYFNAQAQAITSLTEDAVRGKNLGEIFPTLAYDFDQPRESRDIALNEIAFMDPKGKNKSLKLTLAPICDPVKGLVGFVSFLQDISSHKELEEKVHLEEEMRKARALVLSENRDEKDEPEFQFEGVIGQGGGIERIYQLVQKVAATTTNVLIVGESGTGKELVARAIHYNGPRRNSPFVAVNCGAIPENLIESELFGHVRGAFTGAVADHEGLFKRANGGTIFLDEAGELPLNLQVKLLRVLQEKAFTPVGGSKQVKVDVRVISATNKDLRKETERSRFREDLFYRLNVVQIVLPPLRSRKEDIPLLAHHFVGKFAKIQGKQLEEISSQALMLLMSYSYPGNIRELENIIEHAVAVSSKNIITDEELPAHVRGLPITEELGIFEKTAPGGGETFFGKGISLDEELETHEKCLLLGALKRSKGVQKRAAEILGINYRSFRHRLEKYDLMNPKHHNTGGNEENPE